MPPAFIETMEHWFRAPTFITVICSQFMLILLFMLMLSIYIHLFSYKNKTRNNYLLALNVSIAMT